MTDKEADSTTRLYSVQQCYCFVDGFNMRVSQSVVFWVLFVSLCESGTSKYVSNIQNPPNGVKARKPIPIVSKTFILQSDLAVRDRGCEVIVFN